MKVINLGRINPQEVKPTHVYVLAAIESEIYTACWNDTDSWEFPGGRVRFSIQVGGRTYLVDVEAEETDGERLGAKFFIPQIRSLKALAGWS